MRARARLPIAAAIALIYVHAGAAAGPSVTGTGKSAVSTYVAAAVDRGDVPGVVVLVVGPDGVLYEGAFGKLDVGKGVSMPANAIFRIASMTKPITSVAVMMLVESGKVKLDDPISQYLPEWDQRPVIATFNATDGTTTTRPAKRPITVRHLLAHTSGIAYAFSNPVTARLLRGTKQTELDLPLQHDPGDRWTYSASTRVLGHLVEKVGGQPLDAFLRDKIFAPLNMDETSFAVPPEKVARVATVHQRTAGKLVEQPNAATQQVPVRGDGGLYSTARDYGMFVRMLVKGGNLGSAKILTSKSVRMMGENQIGSIAVEEQPDADPMRTRPFPIGAGRDKFGLGFQIAVRDGRYAKFRSPDSLSWAGINNTHFWIDPHRRIAAVFMVQMLPFYDEAAMRTLRGFEELVYRHLE